MKIKSLIALIFVLFISTISAQKFNVLSKQEKVDLKLLAAEYIEEFNQHLKVIPKMSNENIRKKMVNRLIKKFMDGATIQVANSKDNINTIPVTKYLDKVLKSYGSRFKIIDIEITSVNISNIKPMKSKPGYYYADFVFVQKYCRSSTNRNIEGIVHYDYCDETTKSGKFIVKKVTTSQGTRWKLFYGDIKVIDYKKF